MSSSQFPVLTGLKWDVVKAPSFKTLIQSAVSGKECRVGLRAYPLYQFDMSYEFLGDGHTKLGNELRKLMGLFLSMRGALDNFLYTDPTDYQVTDQNFGTGDGATTQFQMSRTYGDTFTFQEPIYNINAISNLKVNGVAQTNPTNYSVSATGLVTFVTPPANGHAITWSGTYFFRCRFMQDMSEFSRFMDDLWELKKLQLLGSLTDKV